MHPELLSPERIAKELERLYLPRGRRISMAAKIALLLLPKSGGWFAKLLISLFFLCFTPGMLFLLSVLNPEQTKVGTLAFLLIFFALVILYSIGRMVRGRIEKEAKPLPRANFTKFLDPGN